MITAITAVLMTIIIGLVAIVCVSLFSSAKYGATHRIDELQARIDEWELANDKDNPKLKEHHDRLVTLENRAGVSIGARR